jgi:hypothetical protein
MLGKLIKHSFKANASAVYNNYIALGAIGVIMVILMLIDWTKWGDTGVAVGWRIKVVAAFVLCIAAFICVILTFVSVFGEFNRSMYKSEGYLTLTLPVRSSTLLFSKWLSGSFWVILSYTVWCLCMFGSVLYLLRGAMRAVEGDADYYSIYSLITEMVRQFAEAGGIATPNLTVVFNLASLYAINGGIRAFVFVLIVYMAVTLSHCRPFNRLGKVGAVLYFLGISSIILTISGLIAKLIKVYIVVSQDAFTFALSEAEVQLAWANGYGAVAITNVYVTALLAVAVFLITSYLIDRKVNVNS